MPFEAKVIDVSVYQGNIDWAEVRQSGIYAAVIRAGYGRYLDQEDIKFQQNYSEATNNSMPVGIYWFSYAKTPEEALQEAKICLQVLNNRALQMPLYFDQEEAKIPSNNRTSCAVAFMDYIKQNTKYLVGYYTYTSYFSTVDIPTIQAHCDTIWLADYRSDYNKTIPRDMHQYTSSGTVPGISGRVDMNNLFRDFPTEIKGEENKPMPTSDTLKIGPVSGGDRAAMENLANSLLLNNFAEGDYIVIGPMSGGDKNTIIAKADSLGLGYEDYVAPEPEPEPEPKPEPKPESVPEPEEPELIISGLTAEQFNVIISLVELWGGVAEWK